MIKNKYHQKIDGEPTFLIRIIKWATLQRLTIIAAVHVSRDKQFYIYAYIFYIAHRKLHKNTQMNINQYIYIITKTTFSHTFKIANHKSFADVNNIKIARYS